MRYGIDGKGQTYLEWNRGAPGTNGWARAWVSHRTADKDWAGTGRYLLATRIDHPGGGPAGTGADFPISGSLPDKHVLRAYVIAVSAITGHVLEEGE